MVKVYALNINNLIDPQSRQEIMEGLPEARKKKIMKYLRSEDRKQSLGAGLLLKEVLFRHGVSDEQVQIGENGKPEVENLYFNLSHSGEMVICAISSCPVGCDVEKIRNIKEKVAERFFCENEVKYLKQFQHRNREEEFLRLWTMKESYIKMTGEGMTLPLNQFEIMIDDQVRVLKDGEILSCFIKEYSMEEYKVTVCAVENSFVEQIETVTF